MIEYIFEVSIVCNTVDEFDYNSITYTVTSLTTMYSATEQIHLGIFNTTLTCTWQST